MRRSSAGYQPEIAYFECLHELKLIVDPSRRRRATSLLCLDTAEYGDYVPAAPSTGETAPDAAAAQEVQDGTFAGLDLENMAGRPVLAMRARTPAPIEVVGRKLRSMMAWLKPKVVFE